MRHTWGQDIAGVELCIMCGAFRDSLSEAGACAPSPTTPVSRDCGGSMAFPGMHTYFDCQLPAGHGGPHGFSDEAADGVEFEVSWTNAVVVPDRVRPRFRMDDGSWVGR